jgi:MoaA/NifB/PqqE/SkfB family radical SAM enzyme
MFFSAASLKLYSQKGRLEKAKAVFELITKKTSNNKLASIFLGKTNSLLNLPPDHNSLDTDAAENKRLNEKEIDNRELQLNSTPQVLEIGTTSVCNIIPPCVQCPKHVEPRLGYINKDAHHIPKDYIKRLAPFIRRSVWLLLHGVGEPLTCPYLFDVLKYVEYEDTIKYFCTNGLLLTRENREKILSNKISNISFSLDAATAETYKKIRHCNFREVINNIKCLICERNNRGLTMPKISINMTLMRENIKEVPEFIRLAEQLDANVHLYHLIKGPSYQYGWFDYESQHCSNDPEIHDLYVEEAFKVAEELGVEIIFIGKRSLLKKNPEIFSVKVPADNQPDDSRKTSSGIYTPIKIDGKSFSCDLPWNHLSVDEDGNVRSCCWQAASLGNLKTSSIWEIWNGKTIKEVRKSTAEGVPHSLCNYENSECPYILAFTSLDK